MGPSALSMAVIQEFKLAWVVVKAARAVGWRAVTSAGRVVVRAVAREVTADDSGGGKGGRPSRSDPTTCKESVWGVGEGRGEGSGGHTGAYGGERGRACGLVQWRHQQGTVSPPNLPSSDWLGLMVGEGGEETE